MSREGVLSCFKIYEAGEMAQQLKGRIMTRIIKFTVYISVEIVYIQARSNSKEKLGILV